MQVVTGLHSGVNPVSGDFSVGAEGVMIRGGALAEPVREFTIASTLQRMLLDILAVGSDLEWLPDGDAGRQPRDRRRLAQRVVAACPPPSAEAVDRHPHLAQPAALGLGARRPALPHDVVR